MSCCSAAKRSAALFIAALSFALPLTAQPPKCPVGNSHMAVGSGTYSNQPGVSFELRRFSATLVPLSRSLPGCLQKMTVVSHAEIFVSNASLTEIFGGKLSQGTAKIQDFKVENGDGICKLSGKVKKLIPINFSIEGPVSTDGKLISLQAAKIKADGIEVKELLTLVGAHLGRMLGTEGMPGMYADNDRLAFDPEAIAHLKGHMLSAVSTPAGLTLRYGTPAKMPAVARAPSGKTATP